MKQNIKNLIESNPVAFATITDGDKPSVIGVACVKVVSDNQILITDNYMNQTKKTSLRIKMRVWLFGTKI
jgi:hypothetical protein